MLASRAHVNLYACRNSHGKQSAKSIDVSWYHRSIVSVLERAASVQQMRKYQDRRTDGRSKAHKRHTSTRWRFRLMQPVCHSRHRVLVDKNHWEATSVGDSQQNAEWTERGERDYWSQQRATDNLQFSACPSLCSQLMTTSCYSTWWVQDYRLSTVRPYASTDDGRPGTARAWNVRSLHVLIIHILYSTFSTTSGELSGYW